MTKQRPTVVLDPYRVGPLRPHIDRFAARLREAQYCREALRHKLRVVADLSLWLQRKRVDVSQLDERLLDRFLRRRNLRADRPAVRQMLQLLHDLEVVPRPPAKKIPNPFDRIEQSFERYLTQERRLSRASVLNTLPFVHRFLEHRFGQCAATVEKLHATDVTRFVVDHAYTLSPKRAKLMVGALRSFFRFLFLRGEITINLAAAVPTVLEWRWSTLPKFMEQDQVQRLLGGCDRRTATGRRDFAILLLLARLGLRAGEIAALTLDDIHWEVGEITIRGKGSRQDRLPLPDDVGRALVAYLRQGRPPCATRRVFMTARAPIRPLSGQSAVACLVARALKRAGLDLPRKGAHLLRHTLATEMLRRGAPLAEIGELLRHRHPDTTAIYAKVDIEALRALAQPWPRGA